MKRIIFLEGLPGVGKTTIANAIRNLEMQNVHVVDEIINEKILNNISNTEFDYMYNDELKLGKYEDGIIVIDRGPISSLSYSQTKKIISNEYNLSKTLEWFEKNRYIFNQDVKIVFLTNKGTDYTITSNDQLCPYGSVENQKLLESISIFNCKKYSNNVVIKEYYKKNMEEVISEIIN